MSKLYAFITSRYGLAVIAYVSGYFIGGMSADKRCDADKLAAQLATARADIAISIKAKESADREASALRDGAKYYEGVINDLEARIFADKGRGACRLTGRDAGGLLNIDAGER